MSRIRRWSHVPGTLNIEISRYLDPMDNWHVYAGDAEHPRILPPGLARHMTSDCDGLTIHFEATGSYDPGYRGTPDNCQAPEGEEDRELVRIDIETAEGTATLPHALAELVFCELYPLIEDADVNHS